MFLFLLGALSGSIKDTSGAPLAAAAVAAGAVSGHSDAAGHYSLTALNPGATAVTASAAGFDSVKTSVMINPGVDIVEDIVLTPASAIITGTVRDTVQGSPVSGATVRAGGSSTQTGSNGTYSLSHLSAGQIQISVTATHYHPLQGIVTLIDHQTLQARAFPALESASTRLVPASCRSEVAQTIVVCSLRTNSAFRPRYPVRGEGCHPRSGLARERLGVPQPSQSFRQSREMAIRAAIGADLGRILRQMPT